MNRKILNGDAIDLKASYYIKHSFLQNNLAKDVLSSYRVNPCAHILDVGCGDGKITAGLANHANQGKVLGIDSSQSMIKFALKNFPKKNFPNLDYVQECAERVEFFRQFDLIVSFSCFHWLKDPEEAIYRLSTALKQNGEILILTYPKESPYYRYMEIALKKYPEYSLLSANHTMLSISEYKELFSKNHLEILNFHQQNLFASYNSPKEIQEFIKGWLNSYVPLPENMHNAFLQNVNQAVFEDSTTCNGNRIVIPYTALVIRARKKY